MTCAIDKGDLREELHKEEGASSWVSLSLLVPSGVGFFPLASQRVF